MELDGGPGDALGSPGTVLPAALRSIGRALAAFAALFGAVVLVDAGYVGLFAGPGTLAEYRFGSEAMGGGWAYSSASGYVASGLLYGGGALLAAVVVLFPGDRIPRAVRGLGVLACAACVLLHCAGILGMLRG